MSFRKEIIVGVIVAVITSILTALWVNSNQTIKEHNLTSLSVKLRNDKEFITKLKDDLKRDGDFKGLPGESANARDVSDILKPQVIESLKNNSEFRKALKGDKGQDATLPSGALLIYKSHKNAGVSDNCNRYCWQKGYIGCVGTGAGTKFAGEVRLTHWACDARAEGPVDCLCYK